MQGPVLPTIRDALDCGSQIVGIERLEPPRSGAERQPIFLAEIVEQLSTAPNVYLAPRSLSNMAMASISISRSGRHRIA